MHNEGDAVHNEEETVHHAGETAHSAGDEEGVSHGAWRIGKKCNAVEEVVGGNIANNPSVNHE